MFIRRQKTEFAVERRMRVPKSHERNELLRKRRSRNAIDFIERIIMAIDIAMYARFIAKLEIVFGPPHADIIHLRNAGRKKLQRACDKIFVIIITACRIIRAVDLIRIESSEIHTDAEFFIEFESSRIQLETFPPRRKKIFVAHQIARIDDADTVVRVERRKLFSRTDEEPIFQIHRFSEIQRIEREHRQLKIVGIVSLRFRFFLYKIVFVNFRKNGHSSRRKDFIAFAEQLPNLGFDKKTIRTFALGRIRDRIEADDRSAVFGKKDEIVF